jgi:hypothetical protein
MFRALEGKNGYLQIMNRVLKNASFILLGTLLLSVLTASINQKDKFICLAKAMEKSKHKANLSDTRIAQGSKSSQPESELKEIEIEDKDGKVKKVKAKIKRIAPDEAEVDAEGLGKVKIKGKKVTTPDGSVFDFSPPRREGDKVIFPDGRVIEIKEPPAPPPTKSSSVSDGKSVGSSQIVASISAPSSEEKSLSSQTGASTSVAQNSYPYNVLYIPPGTPECDDDPFF